MRLVEAGGANVWKTAVPAGHDLGFVDVDEDFRVPGWASAWKRGGKVSEERWMESGEWGVDIPPSQMAMRLSTKRTGCSWMSSMVAEGRG